MALYSAGVEIKEIDLTNIVPSLATSLGGYAGSFNWGPAGQLVTVSSEKDLVTSFGAPNNTNTFQTASFFPAASCLKYSNNLKVSRSVEATDFNAASPFLSSTAITVLASAPGAGGTGYTVDDVLTISTGAAGNLATAKVTTVNSGVVTAVTLLTGGSGYSTGGGSKGTTGGTGSNCTLNITTIGSGANYNTITALNATPTAPGSGYVVGNVLTITAGAAGDLATATVTTIGQGGTVTAVTLLSSGSGYTAGSGKLTTGGAGSGCTLNITTIGASAAYSVYNAAAVKNKDVFDALTSQTIKSAIVGRYPGSLGNSLKVVLCRANALAAGGAGITARTSATDFSYVPGTSTYATAVATANSNSGNLAANLLKVVDEIHVAVIDSDGSFTGTAGTILEKYEGLSLFTDAKTENGATNYYREVINRTSNYIYINKLKDSRITTGTTSSGAIETEFAVTDVTALSALSTPLGTKASTGGVTITLLSGANAAMTESGMSDAYDLFADEQSVDLSLLFGEVHNTTSTAVTNDGHLSAIVVARKDCVGFMSAPLSITAETTDTARLAQITNKLGLAVPANSYMVMDSSPVYVYNKYADSYLYIPACGHIAGLCANTDAVADAWFSPAGFNRGQLQDVVKLAYNPNQASRDTLYAAGVNPIVAFPGQGIVLFGDKTRLTKPSAFDRINVRRLFITLEKAIANASKFQLFEQNDDFTRAAFRNIVVPFLSDVQGRRGITDFRVVCDTTNNTGQVIDANSFVADIYIKPTRSINFITLNFIATLTGVEFRTIVGS